MAKQLNVNLNFNANTGKAKQQIQELQSLLNKIAYSGSSSIGDNIANDLREASSAAKELQIHLNNAFNAKTGNFDLSMLDRSLKASGSNVQELGTKLLSAGQTGQQAFMKLAQSIAAADQPMLRLSNRMQEFATTLKNTARWQFSSSILHGMMGAMQSAYGYAQDLNKSLTDIRIVTGANADEMTRFAEQANKAAKNLNTTTTDYTNASLIYFQQGLSDEEVTERTNVTIKMANAAGVSAQTVSDQMTAVWNNFDNGSKSLEYYADVMTALGAATASSTDEIATGLEKFAAVADTVGLSYEYATAALATVTSETRQSADVVGTAFKTLFARLQDLELGETLEDGTTLGKYSKALSAVGIEIQDANGNLKNMDNILNELGEKWDTIDKSSQVALAQTVAGTRQYTQLVSLMDNWDVFQKNLNTATNSTGALQEQADIYAESWEAASKRVKASAEGIYQSLLDDKFFINLNHGFANMLEGLDAFIDGAGGLKTILASIAGIILSNFANKIPQALDNLKYNITVLTKGAGKAYQDIQKDMQAATKDLFEKYGVPSTSALGTMVETSNQLAAARTRLAQVSMKMSDSERQRYEMELSLIEAQQDELYVLRQKNEEIAKSKQELFNAMVNDKDSIQRQNVLEGADNRANRATDALAVANWGIQIESFEELIKVSEDFATSLSSTLATAIVESKNDIINLTDLDPFKKLQKYINQIDLSDLTDADDDISDVRNQIESLVKILPEGVISATGLSATLSKIKGSKNVDQLKNSFKELEEKLNNCKITSDKFVMSLKGFQKPKDVDDLVRYIKEYKSGTEEAISLSQKLGQALKGFQPTHVVRTSEALGSLAGIMGNVVSIGNSVKSMFEAWTNPDLSGWEKLSSTLSGIAMIVPGVTSLLTALGTITSFVNTQTNNYIMSLATAASIKAADAAMTEIQTRAEDKRLKSLRQQNMSIWANIVAEKAGITVDSASVIVEAALGGAKKISTKAALEKIRALLIENGVEEAGNAFRSKHIVLQTIINALTGNFAGLWIAIAAIGIGAIIFGIVKGLDALIVSQKEAQQAISEANEAYDKEKNVLQELNDELSGVQDRINELESKGPLTLTEQAELNRLRAMEVSLQGQVDAQKELLKIEEQRRANAIQENWQTAYGNLNAGAVTTKTVTERKDYSDEGGGWQYLWDAFVNGMATWAAGGSDRLVGTGPQMGTESDAMMETVVVDKSEEDYENWLASGNNFEDWQKAETDYASVMAAYKEGLIELTSEQIANMQTSIRGGRMASVGGDREAYLDKYVSGAASAITNTSALENFDPNKTFNFSSIIDEKTLAQFGTNIEEFSEYMQNSLSQALEDGFTTEEISQLSATELTTFLKNIGNATHEKFLQSGLSFKEWVSILTTNTKKGFDVRNWQTRFNKLNKIFEELEMGDSISAEDYAALGDEYKRYFQLQEDGTATLITSAEVLKSAINDIEIPKLKEQIQKKQGADTAEITASGPVRQGQSKTISVEDATYNAQVGALGVEYAADYIKYINDLLETTYDTQKEAAAAFLSYMGTLEAEQAALAQATTNVTDLTALLDEGLITWEQYQSQYVNLANSTLIAATTLSELDAAMNDFNNLNENDESYTQNLMRIAEGYESCEDALNDYQAALNNFNPETGEGKESLEQAESALRAQIALEEAAEEYELDVKVLTAQSQRLAKEYELTAEEAGKLAIKNQRMNKGVEALNKNWTDWKEHLKTSHPLTQDYAEAVVECTSAIADLVGASDDLELPDSFFESETNLALIEKAMEGDINAINQLGAAVATQTVKILEFDSIFADLINQLETWDGKVPDITLSTTQFETDKEAVLAGINDIKNGVISAGGAMDGEWVAALNRMALTTGMSVEEMNGLLGSLGVQAKVKTTYVPQKMSVPTYTEVQEPILVEGQYQYFDGTSLKTDVEHRTMWRKYTVPGPSMEVKGYAAVAQISTEDNPLTLDVESDEAPGGSPSAASYTGNRGPVTPSATQTDSGGDQKRDTTKKSDVVERYKEINDKLADQEKALDKASKAADRLWGPNRVQAMKDANDALKENIDLLKDKRAEAEFNLKQDKQALKDTISENANITITDAMFDKSGNFTAYDEVLNGLYNELHKTESDAGSEWSERDQKKIDGIQDRIDKVKEAISQYDETNTLIKDLDTQIQDEIYKWQDNNYEILNLELEYKVDINEKELEIIDYYLGKAADDLYAYVEAMDYYDQQHSIYTNNLANQETYVNDLTEAYNKGKISEQAYKEGLASSQSVLISNLQSLEETKKAMQDYYGNVMAMAIEEIGIYTAEMEQLNSVLDHYSNIMDIVGKQDDYTTKNKILNSKASNIKNELATQSELYEKSSAEAEYWSQKMSEAIVGSNEYETYKKNWQAAQQVANETQDAMLAKTQEWAEAMKSIIENELAELANTLEESLTGGVSFDELLTSMERRSSLQEEYLTTTNQIYETNKMMRAAQQEIDKTSNTVAKKKLQSFINETNQLQNQTELSQYELDIQQAKYDLLLAEIALEEAQNAKSTVRLQRDSEGNFGYVYTADAAAVSDAEQKLADAQNNLYNIGLEGANNYQQKQAEILQESQDAITELTQMWMNGEIESEEEFNRRKKEIVQYYGDKLKQYSKLHTIALSTDSRVLTDAWSSDFIKQTVSVETWKTKVDSYFSEAATSMETWAQVTKEVMTNSGLNNMDETLGDVNEKSKDLILTLLGKDGKGGVVGAMMSEVDTASSVSEAHVTIQTSIDTTIGYYEDLLTAINNAHAAMTTPVKPAILTGGGTYTPPGTSNTSGNSGSGSSYDNGSYDTETVKKAQHFVGATADGKWGPKSAAAAAAKGYNSLAEVVTAMTNIRGGSGSPLGTGGGLGRNLTYVAHYDTGGYTGTWGSYGKLAMLHEKELVLNKQQTQDLLLSMEVLERILQAIDLQSINSQIGGILSTPGFSNPSNGILEQNVHIEASFPNATNHSEIEEAFSNLVNLASQYANRK